MVARELALDGTVRPIKGTLSMAMHARESGFACLLVPEENVQEEAGAPGVDVLGVDRLVQAAEFLADGRRPASVVVDLAGLQDEATDRGLDLADVQGQEGAEHVLEVAGAGGHNIPTLYMN